MSSTLATHGGEISSNYGGCFYQNVCSQVLLLFDVIITLKSVDQNSIEKIFYIQSKFGLVL